MNTPRTTLYRDPKNAKLFGVCAGIADYTGVPVLAARLILIATTIAFGVPALAYLVAAMLIDKKPPYLYAAPAEEKYWQGVRQNPGRTAREVHARMKDIDRRLAEIEQYYVSNNARLSAEIESLR